MPINSLSFYYISLQKSCCSILVNLRCLNWAIQIISLKKQKQLSDMEKQTENKCYVDNFERV